MSDDRWLWDGMIPRGALTVLAYKPDTRTTTVLCDIIGRITNGSNQPLEKPDGKRFQRGSVILLPSEDLEMTLLRSLEGASVDNSKLTLGFGTSSVESLVLGVGVEQDCQLIVLEDYHPETHESWLPELLALAQKRDLAVLVTVLCKTDLTGVVLRGGTSLLGSMLRLILYLQSIEDGLCLSTVKNNLAAHSSYALRVITNDQSLPEVEWLTHERK